MAEPSDIAMDSQPGFNQQQKSLWFPVLQSLAPVPWFHQAEAGAQIEGKVGAGFPGAGRADNS